MSEIQKHTKPNVPNLRFPGFSGEWGLHLLSEFCQKITRKNKGNVISNVLCNSANQGIIPQSEYFDRAIANSDNTAGYYIIEQDDFVYNPRKSTTAPYGPVNIYHGSEPGIISPLYLCFKTTGINREFLYYFFKSKSWWPYMYENGDSGVRHDRVSIKDDVFFSMPIHMPSIKEQDKIANILSLIDQRISIQNKIIEHYRSLISTLYEVLIRSSNSIECTIGDILSIGAGKDYKHLSNGTIPVYGTGGYMLSVNDWLYDGESVCIGRKGTIDHPFYVKGKFWTVDTLFYTHSFHGILPKYCYYLFQTIEWQQYNEASGVPSLSKSTIEKIKVRIPSIKTQAKAVAVLDTIEESVKTGNWLVLSYQRMKEHLLSHLII